MSITNALISFLLILVYPHHLYSSSSVDMQKTTNPSIDQNKIRNILEKADDLYRSRSSTANLLMTIKTPNWERTLEMAAWSQGKDKTLIRILSPKKERGVSTLKIEKQMWNYFPKINQVIKIPNSMMMGSWMGSDFTNDDLVKEFRYSEDFSYSGYLKKDRYIITLIPKKNTISIWSKIEAHIDKKTEIPIEEYYYNDKNVIVRHMRFLQIEKHDDRYIPMIIKLENLSKKGHSTTIEYKTINLNKKIDASIFTRQNLQKRI